ncbi:hypothetical protein ANO11243_028670 [Dothideomycetidae sp. 11243]|nr:hypothetical protein ANO11243_028670 [fungal sp. No.11243]
MTDWFFVLPPTDGAKSCFRVDRCIPADNVGEKSQSAARYLVRGEIRTPFSEPATRRLRVRMLGLPFLDRRAGWNATALPSIASAAGNMAVTASSSRCRLHRRVSYRLMTWSVLSVMRHPPENGDSEARSREEEQSSDRRHKEGVRLCLASGQSGTERGSVGPDAAMWRSPQTFIFVHSCFSTSDDMT